MLYLNTKCLLIFESASYIALSDAAAFKLQVRYYTACFILEIYFDVVNEFVLEFMAQAATGVDSVLCIQIESTNQAGHERLQW